VFNLDLAGDTMEAARERLAQFLSLWQKTYPSLGRVFRQETVSTLFAYLSFPFRIRRMIDTTNWIERLNRDIRKGTRQRLSFPTPDSALNLVWAIVIDRETRTYRHPVTAFLPVKEELDQMLIQMKKGSP